MRKVLIIGFGGAGRRFYEFLREISTIDIAILNTSKSKKIDEFGDNIQVFASIEDTASYNPDMVYIATPTSTHLEYAELFLGRTKFLLIEKPLDSNLNKCEVFYRNSLLSSTKVYIMFQRRFLKCWQKVYELVRNNYNGIFQYATIDIKSNCSTWRAKPQQDFYALNKAMGGGVLLTECHEIDLVQWLLGDIIEVFASSVIQNEVESKVHLVCSIQTKWGRGHLVIDLDFLSNINKRIMEIVFTNEKILIDENLGSVVVQNHELNTVARYEYHDKMNEAYRGLLSEIMAGNEQDNNTAFIASVEDGLKVNAVVEAAKNSMLTRQMVLVKDSVCPDEGVSVLNKTIKLLIEEFGDRLIAIYGLGSLGYGGYVAGWSDFDIDVLIHTNEFNHIDDFNRGKRVENIIQQNGYQRIDIRVYSPTMLNRRETILSYGQCSRALMLADSAVLFMGKDVRSNIERPTVIECDKEAISLISTMLNKDINWWIDLPWDDIAAHFALVARFLYTHDTGKVAGKQMALEYLLNNWAYAFSDSEMQWFLWALACRVGYNPFYIQAKLHDKAVNSLKSMLNKVRNILEKKG